MRKAGRWLLNVLAGLSLLLCVAVVGLWIATARGGHLMVRLSRANGRTVTLRDGPDPGHAWLTVVSRFPHQGVSGVWRGRPVAGGVLPGYTPIALEIRSTTTRQWPRLGAEVDALQARAWAGDPLGRVPASAAPVRAWNVFFPHRLAAVATALPPITWLACRLLVRRARRRRAREGRCLACDYDLTGNVSGVCPECGTRLMRNA